jgi:serine/threonine protein kinase
MDWGVAQILGDAQAAPRSSSAGHSVVGTRDYMPPEQARGESVDQRADVYALGGILQFLLAGGPRPLEAIARKACAPAPGDRYPDVLSLAADVEHFLAGEPVTASPETALDRLLRFSRKHRAAIIMVAAYLVLRVVIALLAP